MVRDHFHDLLTLSSSYEFLADEFHPDVSPSLRKVCMQMYRELASLTNA